MGGGVARGATVTNTNDSGSGSLRQAIADASPGETIDFAVTGMITLTSGQLTIDKDLTISGPGAGMLSIDGGVRSRVFRVGSGNVTICGVTVVDGREMSLGGGIYIRTTATLTLGQVTVTSNVTEGPAKSWGYGGGVYNNGTLTVLNCTISNNRALGGDGDGADPGDAGDGKGGGIYNNGTLTVFNSTISDNTACGGDGEHPEFWSGSGEGGGIYSSGGPTFVMISSVSNNRAVPGNPIWPSQPAPGLGGRIWLSKDAVVTVIGTTIKANTARGSIDTWGSYANAGLGGGRVRRAGWWYWQPHLQQLHDYREPNRGLLRTQDCW